MSFEQQLEKYAELAIRAGVNLQPGQTLLINAPVESADFVRLAARKAYDAGARDVQVEWTDAELSLNRYLHASEEALGRYPQWKADGLAELAREGAAFLYITTAYPDRLKSTDPAKIALASKAAATAQAEYKSFIRDGRVSWSMVPVPNPEWAAKVLPQVPADQAEDALWELIFRLTRANADDPVQAWKEHVASLQEKIRFLNEKRYKRLHYRGPGTELTVELPEKHIWEGGNQVNEKGVAFLPNLPTEEVFTLPVKEGVNGTVVSTKPLIYGGSLIEKLSLSFEKGKIVDFSAESGYEAMKRLLDTDEGARYLGEVALVPHHSPVSSSNVVFYNTLFDENASCHLAVGAAYPTTLENGVGMTPQELARHGANQSLTHVDFMIGSEELDIDGETADGKREPLFRSGNWAI